MKYHFINEHRHEHAVQLMCQLLEVSPSGFYEWVKRPLSDRAIEDQRLLVLIRASYTASRGVYGYRRVHLDLREVGETCGKHRVARIMKSNDIRAIHGYKIPRGTYGRSSIIAPNKLQREFTVDYPDRAWVTDITYIRTWQGWLYLAVVMDLFARKVIGWSMKPTLARDLVLDAILMAVWRRKPKRKVIVHSCAPSAVVGLCPVSPSRRCLFSLSSSFPFKVTMSQMSQGFLEAGKKRLAGDTAREANSDEVKELRSEAAQLKEALAETLLENRLLKKSTYGAGGDDT